MTPKKYKATRAQIMAAITVMTGTLIFTAASISSVTLGLLEKRSNMLEKRAFVQHLEERFSEQQSRLNSMLRGMGVQPEQQSRLEDTQASQLYFEKSLDEFLERVDAYELSFTNPSAIRHTACTESLCLYESDISISGSVEKLIMLLATTENINGSIREWTSVVNNNAPPSVIATLTIRNIGAAPRNDTSNRNSG